MRHVSAPVRLPLLAWAFGLLVTACGGESSHGTVPPDGGGTGGGGVGGGVSNHGGGGGLLFGDGGTPTPDAGDPPPVDAGPPVVYAHNATALYKVDATTNELSKVADFNGCKSSVGDLALDKDSNAFVSDGYGLWRLDLTTATCTLIAWADPNVGYYPNSLSFVPAGTLDPTSEVLVGYAGADYMRIDTTTGAMSKVGTLGDPDLWSSGDIVSVAGLGSFLTVYNTNYQKCNDCLVQVDPKTGAVVQNYGNIGRSGVYGLAFWGGNVYGFNDLGTMFVINYKGGTMQVTDIPVPSSLGYVGFFGAGSTTSAPPKDADGDTFPTIPK